MVVSLKAARISRGLSRAEVAKQLGVSERTVESWESGQHSPKLKDVIKLLDLYGCSFEDLKFF